MSRASEKTIGACGLTKVYRESLGMRQCPDLGLWCLDNGSDHCRWRTEACKDCYNRKTLIYPNMQIAWGPGGTDDQKWEAASSEGFYGLARTRLNTRGEAFSNRREVMRVAGWIRDNPNTLFWIVTRAWQTGMNGSPERWYRLNMGMIKLIEREILCFDNARVHASIDDWTAQHWEALRDRGWNTMYFSRDLNPHPALGKDGARVWKCRKTWDRIRNPETNRWQHRKAVCRTCRNGCFASDRHDIWLKFHW